MGRNFHVLICHGPLQIATFWRVAPSTFTTVYVSEIWKGPTSVDITLSTRNQKHSVLQNPVQGEPLLTRPL